MALAAISSEPFSRSLFPVLSTRYPGRSEPLGRVFRGPDVKVAALIHVIHPDEAAATGLAQSWERLGVRTQFHASADAFARSAPSDEPGCLVVHVSLARQDRSGLAVDYPVPDSSLPMIVTADSADVRTAVLAMKAGAIDFFEMPLCHQELGEAVEIAIRIDQSRRQVDALRTALTARYAILSRREREVMGLVTQGRLNKQIAADLNLSEITIKVHRGSVMRKMEARTLAALVRMADMLASCTEQPERMM